MHSSNKWRDSIFRRILLFYLNESTIRSRQNVNFHSVPSHSLVINEEFLGSNRDKFITLNWKQIIILWKAEVFVPSQFLNSNGWYFLVICILNCLLLRTRSVIIKLLDMQGTTRLILYWEKYFIMIIIHNYLYAVEVTLNTQIKKGKYSLSILIFFTLNKLVQIPSRRFIQKLINLPHLHPKSSISPNNTKFRSWNEEYGGIIKRQSFYRFDDPTWFEPVHWLELSHAILSSPTRNWSIKATTDVTRMLVGTDSYHHRTFSPSSAIIHTERRL